MVAVSGPGCRVRVVDSGRPSSPTPIGTLIAGALSVITLGILAGPLTAGLYNMVIARMRDGRRAALASVGLAP